MHVLHVFKNDTWFNFKKSFRWFYYWDNETGIRYRAARFMLSILKLKFYFKWERVKK